jgi:hypothetical protein
MKVVKKILNLEFIEISEITSEDIAPLTPGRPAPPARLPVTDISLYMAGEIFSDGSCLGHQVPLQSP